MNLTTVKELGRGGFGIVELVESPQGQRFARKRFSVNQPMPPELIPNVLKRFRREADLQSGIKHPNIVPIFHKELDGDAPWYLMPVADSTLADELAVDRRLNGNFKRAVSDIIAGLEELHGMEMFHRDLKPQNVLRFTDIDGGFYYALSDFGFISLKDSKLSKLTYTGMKKGADYFTAPEMTKDFRTASAQADIYSLGCIIHEMVGLEDRVPCSEIREVSEYSGLLINCTRLSPERRFATVSIVREIFLSIEDGALPVSSAAGASLVEILDNPASLQKDNLIKIVEFVEDNAGNKDCDVVLRKINIDHIQVAWSVDANLSRRLGIIFSDWISDGTFDFEYCDVLRSRAAIFLEHGKIDLQVEILMALLRLGTSHNRWSVEGLFRNACLPSMDDALAKRLAVEFRAQPTEACRMIAHLEQSISADRNSFHPTLVATLAEICQ